MKFDPEIHHRRSIRLRGYDYSRAGAYFITICTQNRACLLGTVIDCAMELSDGGNMIQAAWDTLPEDYPGIETDAFVVMPNHIHGIVVLAPTTVGAGPRACPEYDNSLDPTAKSILGPIARMTAKRPRREMSLPDVVHRFKSLTTNRYMEGVKRRGWARFNGRLWQRNYYEHIIRNERALEKIQRYIIENPSRWERDWNHPEVTEPRNDLESAQ